MSSAKQRRNNQAALHARIPAYTGLHIGIPSANRSHHVPEMEAHTLGRATWYVPEDQKADYQYAGAARVRGVPDPQYPRALNWVLADAWTENKVAVLTDDDYKRGTLIRKFNANGEGKHDLLRSTFMQVVTTVYSELMLRPLAKLAGVAPTDNPFFSRKPVHTAAFISSKLMVVEPCDLWFDETMSLKMDYDYTMQHLMKYGEVARIDKAVTRYDSGVAKGGCQDYRNDDLERSMAEILTRRYPHNITYNTRRGEQTEVLLKWKGPTA